MSTAAITRPIRQADPAEEPLSRADAKVQIEIAAAVTAHDDLIDDLISAARADVEEDIRYVLIDGRFLWIRACWPANAQDPIRIPIRNVTAINAIQYYDTADAQQTYSADEYRLDLNSLWPEIRKTDLDTSWPDLKARPDAIELDLQAGYASQAAVPQQLVRLVAVKTHELFERGSDRGQKLADLYERLVARHRFSYLGPA